MVPLVGATGGKIELAAIVALIAIALGALLLLAAGSSQVLRRDR